MTKVWIVYPSYGNDGYGEPECAFSSRAAADAFVASKDLISYWVAELTVDERIATDAAA